MNLERLIEKGMKTKECQRKTSAEDEVQRWTAKRRTALLLSLL